MFQRWLQLPERQSCLVIGPRRSGKTTLLKNRFPNLPYTTLDDLDDFAWAKQDPKGFVSRLGKTAVIDEIQRLPILTVAVKYAVDNEAARFYMTGSSTVGLLDAAADSLAGRIALISLPTACWGEEAGPPTHSIFHDRADFRQIKEAHRRLDGALTYGQFPELIAQQSNEEKESILTNYRNTYFTRDLMQLSNIENLGGLMAVFHHLIRSLGSHLEVSSFAREAGISHPTAKKYLNALHQAQMTFRLYGFQYGPAKRYVKASKTYFCDNGVIHSFRTDVTQGQLLENFVIGELEKRRKLGFIETEQFYYYKSTAGSEIDLVFEADDGVYAVEVKSTRKPGPKDLRSLAAFEDRRNRPVKRFLFYLGDEYKTVGNVQMVPVGALFRGR